MELQAVVELLCLDCGAVHRTQSDKTTCTLCGGTLVPESEHPWAVPK